MSTPGSHMRRGTKSCAECRRRKLRCSWTTENARRCRRCEERDMECVAQTASLSKGPRLSSKDRITRLESQLDHLSRALRAVESKVGHVPTNLHTPEDITSHQPAYSDSEDEEDTSERDEIIVQDDQHGIRGLFQNEWLDDPKSPESKTTKNDRALEDPDLASARTRFQALIPDREDVLALAGHVTGWSKFIATMFPTFAMPDEEQMISSYDQMKTPNVDVWTLANWLLVLALSAQQVPQESNSPGQMIQSMRKRYLFANAVADVAESSIFSHDRLLGTVQGLELCPGFLRVMMTRGRIQKAWLWLRRLIAVAEFMGLPRLARINELHNGSLDGEKGRCARLWLSICVIDRVISTLNGLPVATRFYSIPNMPVSQLVSEKQPLEHFINLSNLAMKVQDVEEARPKGEHPNHYAAILEIDEALRQLGNTMPSSWHMKSSIDVSRSEIVGFMHHAFTLQLHVRYILREDSTGQYTHSKTVGVHTCQLLTRVWRRLREALPFGFFLFAVMDIQAFTAVVTMMLISATGSSEPAFAHIDRDSLASQVEDTVQIFERNARKPYSSKFVKRAATTLRNLRDLLEGKGAQDSPSLVLNVPLLGKVHVRKDYNSRAQRNMPQSMNDLRMQAAMQPESYEALSWMIEDDGEMLFQDYLMMDDNEDWLQVGQMGVI